MRCSDPRTAAQPDARSPWWESERRHCSFKRLGPGRLLTWSRLQIIFFPKQSQAQCFRGHQGMALKKFIESSEGWRALSRLQFFISVLLPPLDRCLQMKITWENHGSLSPLSRKQSHAMKKLTVSANTHQKTLSWLLWKSMKKMRSKVVTPTSLNRIYT